VHLPRPLGHGKCLESARHARLTSCNSTRIDLLFTMSDITRILELTPRSADWFSHERASEAQSCRAQAQNGRATRKSLNPKTVWWSQTGSNRRPPACKAGALPTELWPRTSRQASAGDTRPPAPKLRRTTFASCEGWLANRSGVSREGWWAWEDLNFRPHAYQARALTN
jgi:hypothetical protein